MAELLAAAPRFDAFGADMHFPAPDPRPLDRDSAALLHELGNLLLPLLGHGAMALAAVPANHRAHANLLQMLHSAERAAALLRRVQAGGGLQPAMQNGVDVATVVRDCAGLLRGSLPPRARLSIRVGEAPLRLRGDAGLLHQVLLNLGLNAARALPARGGNIDFAVDTVRLTEPLQTIGVTLAPGCYLRLSVRDDGDGMDAATRARAFEPCFSTNAERNGRGLGLAIVRDIVDAHGGGITVDSELGRGSSFDVLLPAPARL